MLVAAHCYLLHPAAPHCTPLQVPQDSLPLADAVRVAVHEATAALTAECEQQRLSAAAAREAAHRAESEAARISRENARLAAAVVRVRVHAASTASSCVCLCRIVQVCLSHFVYA